MNNITITVNLSDLVDVINNSKNPEVCQHIMSGGNLKDLDKRCQAVEYYTNRIIWGRKDGEKTDDFTMLKAIGYDIWKDEVRVGVIHRSDKVYHRSEYSWREWCNLEEIQGDEFALAFDDREPNEPCYE